MDEPERHRPGKGEDVAAAELGELVGDEPAVDDLLELLPEGAEDDRHQDAPERKADADDRGSQPVRPPGVGEQRAVHAGTSAASAVVEVQLEERLLEVGRLDRQVEDDIADRRQERADVALEPAGDQAPAETLTSETPGTPSRSGGGPAETHLHIALAPRQERRDVLEGHEAPGLMIATRSQTRSTSESTCDEKKIVRPARLRSSRMP